MTLVTRFAPSPTGRLHLGHAFSALSVQAAALGVGGRVLLRIEDIDRQRCRPEFESAIYEDLAWLGLKWETPIRRQSEHMADYDAALDRLRDQGLLYRCFRTRKEVLDAIASAPHGPVEPFRGEPLPLEEEHRRIEAGELFAWRLSLDRAKAALGAAWDDLTFREMDEDVEISSEITCHPGRSAAESRDPALAAEVLGPGSSLRAVRDDRVEVLRSGDRNFQQAFRSAHPDTAGDVVLARKEVGIAYHLACVVDDALQGVTHVIRGEDLREAAHIQRLLQALLDLPTPLYRHHRLLRGPDGKRLAKRDGSKSLGELRVEGADPATIRAELGFPSQ